MTYKHILAFDPSGNFHEGKGVTGWCIYDTVEKKLENAGTVNSSDYACMEEYWDSHLTLLYKYQARYKNNLAGVIEDYLLYASKANSQINSKLETPKLIGVLQHYCYTQNIRYHMQLATEVKQRWSNEILLRKGLIAQSSAGFYVPGVALPLNKHSLDAIRHAVHFATFKNK